MPKEMKEEFKKYSDSREYLYASELSFARRHKAENFIAWLDWREGYLTAVEAEREVCKKECKNISDKYGNYNDEASYNMSMGAIKCFQIIRSRSK